MTSAPTLRSLLAVWLALLALLALTAGSAFLPLDGMNGAVSLAVAVAKTALVLTFFMRLRIARGATRLAASAGFGFLAVLLAIAWFDTAMRLGRG